MNLWMVAGLAAVGTCVISQGFFSGSEMAFVSANRARLETLANEGNLGAKLALELLEREDQLLGTCLIGTNISLITGATIISAMVLSRGGPELMATLVFTPVALIFGEALPKTVYQHHANRLVPWLARPLRVAQSVFRPLLWVVGKWASVLGGVLGRETHPSRQELVMLLDADLGSDIKPRERTIIRRVLELDETDIEAAMTPLVEVQAVPEEAAVEEAIRMILRHGHSRLLVYRNRVDNIVGMVEYRRLLFEATRDESIEKYVTPVPYVPETKSARELLDEMRERGFEMTAVVDEYGGVVGVVTLEDLLEEMFGEIHDEGDEVDSPVKSIAPNVWRVPGRTEIEVASNAMGVDLPEGDYETVAGMLLAEIGKIPSAGETYEVEGMQVLVVDANDRVVVLVEITLP